MKSGKAILVTGIIGVAGIFGYLYLKNNKKDTVVNTNINDTDSKILSTKENNIVDTVIEKLQKIEDIKIESSKKEAEDYIAKKVLIDKRNSIPKFPAKNLMERIKIEYILKKQYGLTPKSDGSYVI